MNILLTGARGAGKTTVCRKLAEMARAKGFQPQGVVCPALYDDVGIKVGFEAEDAGSGERWLLAHTDLESGGPQIGPYVFDSFGLARANGVLERACQGSELLMLDEVGPLELKRGEGFAPILSILPLQGQGHVFIVVRPSLLAELRSRLGHDFSIYTVSEGNREVLPVHIGRELWPDD